MCPIQLAFLLFIVCSIMLSSLTLCYASSFLTRSVQMIFSSSAFQIFPDTSDLLSEMSTFEHHTKLCFTSSTLLVSFLHIVQYLDENSLLLVESCFGHGNPRYNLTCTSCIICCHATQTFEIHHSSVAFDLSCSVFWMVAFRF
jgi:hypothetical protein